jgi:serine/threonine-protein kinase
MGRRVAIKELLIPAHLAGTQKRERIERFYREAKAAGTLAHPNIVTIYDVGQENERHFIAMEYLEGHSLREIQQMQGALPLKETLEIALQLCDALGYAHSRGIVHRDVKPDNVHILPGGVIKLTDFGIARITAEPSITAQGQVFGTPSYMSPEQVASHTVDHRTDIFSLGITLYEMLTGRKPFAGDSVITITYNIMNMQPPMPAGVPTSLHTILQRALAKDPNMRYQNMAALAADLRQEKFSLENGYSPKGAQAAVPQAPAAPQFQQAPVPQIQQSPPPQYNQAPNLNTGTVPPEISGIPAMQQPPPQYYPQQPANPYATNYPNSLPPQQQQQGKSSEMGNQMKMIAIIGLIVIVILGLIWAIITVTKSHSASNGPGMTLYRQANADYQSGNYEEATKLYAQAKVADPENTDLAQKSITGLSDVATQQGNAAAQKNDIVAAQEDYKKAIQIDSKNALAYDNLGNLQIQQGDKEGALQSWQASIDADRYSDAAKDAQKNAANLLMDTAKQASAGGDINTARSDWQKVVKIAPGSDQALQAQTYINGSISLNNTPVASN